jgi:hypothetical protein
LRWKPVQFQQSGQREPVGDLVLDAGITAFLAGGGHGCTGQGGARRQATSVR